MPIPNGQGVIIRDDLHSVSNPTSPAGPPLPRPDHPVDDLGEAVVAGADGAAEVPTAADLATQHVARQHLPLALHLDHAALLYQIASVPEYLCVKY